MIKKFISGGYLFLILAFIYAPIFLLVIYSFTDTKFLGTWDGFSLELYRKLVVDVKLRNTLVNTVVLAVLSGVLSTVIGTLGAIGIFYNKKIFGKFTKSSSQITVINAEIVTAISLALVCSLFAFNRTYYSLLIGHVSICAPFVVLSVMPKLKQMDGSLYEAALDLGATPTQALFKAVIPEILPGIFSGFMLAITLSLDDYMITWFTKPSTFDTISTYVYGAVKNSRNSSLPALRALTTVIFLIIIIAVVLMNFKKEKNLVNKKNF